METIPETKTSPTTGMTAHLAGLGLAPDDEANRTLADNVHPSSWTNPEPAPRYHLVVVGAGTAGLVAAAGAAGLGARVALVERHLMGGDCLNVGCVPSKAIIRSGRAAADILEAPRFGVTAGGAPQVDFGAVMSRMRRIRARVSPNDSVERFAGHYGVDVFLGAGRFTGPRSLEVDGARLRFSRAVIATGARPVMPPIPGLAAAGTLTNETVFNLTELPERLAVIGGGPIGCELAQTFARLGSRVTLVERSDQFLPREDRDAALVLQAAMERDGVRILLSSNVVRVEAGNGPKVLHVLVDGVSGTVETDAILVGVGRAPNVEGLGLGDAGVAYGPEGVRVDDHLRTSNRRIFAAGDVCLPFKFTHTADAAARAVIQNAFFGFAGRKRVSRMVVPWCTYTDPEIAHVGLNERMATEAGVAIDTYLVPMDEVDRALAEGDSDGFLKVHTRRGKDTIVGATLVSRHAGETLSELTLAMEAGVGLGRLASVIHPYPTQAEAIRKAADAFNRTRLTPRSARLLRAVISLHR